MSDHELERFEEELRGVAPAQPPQEFMARLQAAKPGRPTAPGTPVARPMRREPAIWRWPAPALAMSLVVAALVVARMDGLRGARNPAPPTAANLPVRGAEANAQVKPDRVRVDEELVLLFDVVATLPDGAPVRFRCQQWLDQLELSDPATGLVIKQSAPRVEVTPVRYETY